MENLYAGLILQLKEKFGQKIFVKVKHPDSPATSYSGLLMIIRDDSCILRNEQTKERISIPYLIITEIKT